MAELPWFPLYVERFLGSRKIRRMTAEQVGMYILLLVEEWDDGPLADDDAELEFVGRGKAHQVREILDLCFVLTEDGWVNEKLEEVREEQASKRRQAVEAGRRGGMATAKLRKKTGKKPGKTKKKKEKKKDPGLPPEVSEVWDYWQAKRSRVVGMSGPDMKKTNARLGAISGRLKDGYTVGQLKEAVDGCLGSDRNVKGGYIDIELICRSQSKVEQYRQWKASGGRPSAGDSGEPDIAEDTRKREEARSRDKAKKERERKALEEAETSEHQRRYDKTLTWYAALGKKEKEEVKKDVASQAKRLTRSSNPSAAVAQGIFMSIAEKRMKEKENEQQG